MGCCESRTKTASSSPTVRTICSNEFTPRLSPIAKRFFACAAAFTIHPAAKLGCTVFIGPVTFVLSVFLSIANNTMPSMSDRCVKISPMSAWSRTPHVSTSEV